MEYEVFLLHQHISGKLGLNKLSGEFLTNAHGGRDELEPR